MLTIGQFAQMSRLSAKQLRTYDAAGLLAPARTDPRTGYRSYHPRQVRTALTIAMLRSLDVPLERIRELLVAGDAEVQALLVAERARLLAEAAERERVARSLARLSGERELMPYAVTAATEPELRLATVATTTTAEDLHRDATALIARAAHELPAPPGEPLVGLYPADFDGAFAIAVGVPSAEPTVVVPAGPVARVTHVGPHDELALAYFPLLAWVHERGHAPAGPLRERYLDDPATVPPERLRTEVTVPLTEEPA